VRSKPPWPREVLDAEAGPRKRGVEGKERAVKSLLVYGEKTLGSLA